MKLVLDPVQRVHYVELTQQEFEKFQEICRKWPDFKAMSLEQLVAYRWPKKDEEIQRLEKQAIEMIYDARAKRLPLATETQASIWLLGLEARVAPIKL